MHLFSRRHRRPYCTISFQPEPSGQDSAGVDSWVNLFADIIEWGAGLRRVFPMFSRRDSGVEGGGEPLGGDPGSATRLRNDL